MSLLKGIACGFVVLIALVVGAREVPECAHLADDASNDGIAVSLDLWTSQAPSRFASPEERGARVAHCPLPTAISNNAHLPAFSALGKAGPELLRLLDLQRE